MEALLILCCALEAADQVLLPATFHALEHVLKVTPSQLGVLTLCQTMAYSLALPLWGASIATVPARDLLALGCVLWGTATAMLTFSTNYHTHLFLRVLNGASLSGVAPVAQALLSNLVSEENRGSAFGRLAAVATLSRMIAAWLAVTQQSQVYLILGHTLHGWQFVYLQVALASALLAVLVYLYMPVDAGYDEASRRGGFGLKQSLATAGSIFRIPSFVLLVAQGVTGGIPWNALAFMTLYYQSCGFSDNQAGRIAVVQGVGGVIGALLGGYLGDAAAKIWPNRGRIVVALASVGLSLPTFTGMFMLIPRRPEFFWSSAAAVLIFSIVGTWCPVAANRPICAELVNSPTERAQVVALWVMIEGVSASIFGAPLVGFLSEQFGYRLSPDKTTDANIGAAPDPQTSAALAKAMVGIAVIAWSLCLLAWACMSLTLPHDRAKARKARSLAQK